MAAQTRRGTRPDRAVWAGSRRQGVRLVVLGVTANVLAWTAMRRPEPMTLGDLRIVGCSVPFENRAVQARAANGPPDAQTRGPAGRMLIKLHGHRGDHAGRAVRGSVPPGWVSATGRPRYLGVVAWHPVDHPHRHVESLSDQPELNCARLLCRLQTQFAA